MKYTKVILLDIQQAESSNAAMYRSLYTFSQTNDVRFDTTL